VGVGRIDTLGVICTFGIQCQGTFDDKIDFVFDTFDLNANAHLNKDELVRAQCSSMVARVAPWHEMVQGASTSQLTCPSTDDSMPSHAHGPRAVHETWLDASF